MNKKIKKTLNNYNYMPTIFALENTIISSDLIQAQKDILLKDLEELRCATTDLKDLEIIHSYDVSKIEKALKLGKLYKELSLLERKRATILKTKNVNKYNQLNKEIEIINEKIKELENERTN